MTIFAYLRISDKKQDERSQRARLIALTARDSRTVDEWVVETQSGGLKWQDRELATIVQDCKSGDWLYISEISRVARSLGGILGFLEIALERGLQIRCAEPEITLDSSILTKVVCFAFGLAAEFERYMLKSRTRAALDERRAAGIVLGRRTGSRSACKLDKHAAAIRTMAAAKVSAAAIGRTFGAHRITVGNWLLRDTEAQKAINVIALFDGAAPSQSGDNQNANT